MSEKKIPNTSKDLGLLGPFPNTSKDLGLLGPFPNTSKDLGLLGPFPNGFLLLYFVFRSLQIWRCLFAAIFICCNLVFYFMFLSS